MWILVQVLFWILWYKLMLRVEDRIVHQNRSASECISIVAAEKCKVNRGR